MNLKTSGSEDIARTQQFFDTQLFSYKQAARFLAVSESHLRKLKAKGKIPYVPMGNRGIRFSVKSLNEWVERREIK
jgi:excisionase family DNA binding protein